MIAAGGIDAAPRGGYRAGPHIGRQTERCSRPGGFGDCGRERIPRGCSAAPAALANASALPRQQVLSQLVSEAYLPQ